MAEQDSKKLALNEQYEGVNIYINVYLTEKKNLPHTSDKMTKNNVLSAISLSPVESSVIDGLHYICLICFVKC